MQTTCRFVWADFSLVAVVVVVVRKIDRGNAYRTKGRQENKEREVLVRLLALPRLNGLIICKKGSELERRLRALAVDSFSMRAIGELFTFGPEFAGPLTLLTLMLLL